MLRRDKSLEPSKPMPLILIMLIRTGTTFEVIELSGQSLGVLVTFGIITLKKDDDFFLLLMC